MRTFGRAILPLLACALFTTVARAGDPPDCDKIEVDKSIMGISVVGAAGAADGDADVRITDGAGNIAEGTANADGSFDIPAGHLEVTACTFLLASQKPDEAGAVWSNACAFHSDPPLVDFATPAWETVYARYLYTQRIDAVSVNGRWMLVRPRAEAISAVERDGAIVIRGRPGAVDAGAVANVALGDGRILQTEADPQGRFEIRIAESESVESVLVSEFLDGKASRSTAISVSGCGCGDRREEG